MAVKFNRYFVSVLLLSFSSLTHAFCKNELVIGWNSWTPYSIVQTDGTVTGLDMEILKAVLDVANCEYRFTEMPVERALESLQIGSVDVVAAASWTQERNEYGLFTIAYRHESIAIFSHANYKDEYRLTSLSDLIDRNVILSANKGSWYGDEYAELIQDPEFQKILLLNTSLEKRIKMLVANRVDLILDDAFSVYSTANKIGYLNDVSELSYKVEENTIHFLLSRKNHSEADIKEFNRVIKSYIKSDAYQDLIASYLK